jgi:Domain of unknown function (DUF4872)/Butirosin biosynthesis protein H, N-terminal
MTQHKHLKQHIRARMEKTGERYTTARRHVIGNLSLPFAEIPYPSARWHVPGNIPATTALRILLTNAGIQAPHTQQPFSEAMLFGIAGGIGIGVFSFYYEKEDIATFFIGGRHAWHDDRAYLQAAAERLGAQVHIQEAGGVKQAEEQLAQALDTYGPCIAWVDMAGMPQRGAPDSNLGSGYHVITVYELNQPAGTALVGDLTDQPVSIALAALRQARSRIKKDRHRILSITGTGVVPDLRTLVYAGLYACHDQLLNPRLPGSQGNARLEVVQTWAERMHGTKGKERWERIFPPGTNLLRGLSAIYDFIEHYGTGGGLCRPLFGEFLAEAGTALGDTQLHHLADQYRELGLAWSALADAALPDDVALLQRVKVLLAEKAELLHTGAPAEAIRAVWQQLAECEQVAREAFPLSPESAAELRQQLHRQILQLYQREVAAQQLIQEYLG